MKRFPSHLLLSLCWKLYFWLKKKKKDRLPTVFLSISGGNWLQPAILGSKQWLTTCFWIWLFFFFLNQKAISKENEILQIRCCSHSCQHSLAPQPQHTDRVLVPWIGMKYENTPRHLTFSTKCNRNTITALMECNVVDTSTVRADRAWN